MLQRIEKLKNELRKRAHLEYKNSETHSDIKILAVGDSWFDYPLVSDIVDRLREMKYAVFKKSKIGNTLEDIVFGTKYSFSYQNKGQNQLNSALKTIETDKPRFVIFSAGGNDIVGENMQNFINHRKTGLPEIRSEILDFTINVSVKNAVEYFFNKITENSSNIDFITHGYDYGFPNGKSYHGIVGPWILPTMAMKDINNFESQRRIIITIVDKFNQMLASLDKKYPNFHHIDIRKMFPEENMWHNEIHLKADGYGKVAEKFHAKFIEILKYNPVENIL